MQHNICLKSFLLHLGLVQLAHLEGKFFYILILYVSILTSSTRTPAPKTVDGPLAAMFDDPSSF